MHGQDHGVKISSEASATQQTARDITLTAQACEKLRRLHSPRFACWDSDRLATSPPTLYLGNHSGRQTDQGASKPRLLVSKEKIMLVTYFTGKSPLNFHFPSSLRKSMSDWLTFATFSKRCLWALQFLPGRKPEQHCGLSGRPWGQSMGRGFWKKAAIFFHCTGVGLFPTRIPLEKSFRRRDVHEICLLTFTLGNLSRHCPQQHLISETLKSHPIQMQIKSFLTITVE